MPYVNGPCPVIQDVCRYCALDCVTDQGIWAVVKLYDTIAQNDGD